MVINRIFRNEMDYKSRIETVKIFIFSLAILLLISCNNKTNERKSNDPSGIKIAAFNVRVSKNASAELIAQKLKEFDFDVVCFSEVPKGNWTQRVATILGHKHVVVGRYSTAGQKDKYKSISSKTPLYGYEEILMADTLHTVTKAKTMIGKREVGIYSIHFPKGWRNQAHIDETTGKITAFLDYLKKQSEKEISIIAGDFNFRPENANEKSIYQEMFQEIGFEISWKELGIDCTKRNTSRLFKPEDERIGKVIDHIIYKPSQSIAVDGEIIEMEKPLSDHKPVWAQLEFKD